MSPAVLLATLLLTPDADARRRRGPEVIERITAEQVADVLRAAGSSVELETDDYGDPLIRAEKSGRSYIILFYECDTLGCQALQFRAWWQTPQPHTAEQLNEFNRTNRNGCAYLDNDRDPTLEMLWTLYGGSTIENFEKTHALYLATFATFENTVLRGQ